MVLSWPVKWLLVMVGYMLGAKLGLLLAIHAGAVTPIWPPTGIALAALFAWGWRCAGAVFAGALLINWINDLPNTGDALRSLGLAGWIAVGNTAGPLLAAWILRRLAFDRDLGRERDVWLLGVAATAAAVLSAANGVTALHAVAGLPLSAMPTVAVTWLVGDALGMASFAPCLLVGAAAGAPWRRQMLPQAVNLLAAAGVAFDPFGLHHYIPTSYLALIPLFWLGIACGPRAVATGYVITASVLVVATNLGYGQMALHHHSPLIALASFLAAACVIALLIAVWSHRWRRLLREAEAGARAKAEFLATMSHELRTPLNGIMGGADLLEADGPAPGQREHIRMIAACGRQLLAQIDALLDLARLDAGRLALERVPSRLGPVAQAVVDDLRPSAARAGLTLTAEIDPALPEVLADPQRVGQILSALVGNAVKFTDRGSVRLRARAEAGWIHFMVTDTGPGIEPPAQSRLFDPFMQVDSSFSRRHEGAGIGLAIARRLARLMGGDITVASAPGAGSVFTCSLPAAAVSGAANG